MEMKRNYLAELLTLTLITGCGWTKFGSRGSSHSTVQGSDDGQAINGEVYTENSGTEGGENQDLQGLEDRTAGTDGNTDQMEDVNNGTPQQQVWQKYGIGLKSARNIFDTMVAASGIPADNQVVSEAYANYAGSLTIEDKNRTLSLSSGQIAAMVNLDRAFCEQVATDPALRTAMYGTGVDFTVAPAALSAQQRQELVNPWVTKLWQEGRASAVPDGQAQSLYASVDKMITDITNPDDPNSTAQLATAACVMVAISFQTFEN